MKNDWQIIICNNGGKDYQSAYILAGAIWQIVFLIKDIWEIEI